MPTSWSYVRLIVLLAFVLVNRANACFTQLQTSIAFTKHKGVYIVELVPDITTYFTITAGCSVDDWYMAATGSTTQLVSTDPLYAQFQLADKVDGVLGPVKFNAMNAHNGR